MPKPATPPVGIVSGSLSLPTGAWSTRQCTSPTHVLPPTHTDSTSEARAQWWRAVASHDLATVAVTSRTERTL